MSWLVIVGIRVSRAVVACGSSEHWGQRLAGLVLAGSSEVELLKKEAIIKYSYFTEGTNKKIED